jgi:hypothetical protein
MGGFSARRCRFQADVSNAGEKTNAAFMILT